METSVCVSLYHYHMKYVLCSASASVDQTMATWGGSTVDNMESITEDGAVQDNDEDEDEDDGTGTLDLILTLIFLWLAYFVSKQSYLSLTQYYLIYLMHEMVA